MIYILLNILTKFNIVSLKRQILWRFCYNLYFKVKKSMISSGKLSCLDDTNFLEIFYLYISCEHKYFRPPHFYRMELI